MIVVLIVLALFIIYLAVHSGPNPDYESTTVNTAPREYWEFFPKKKREQMSVINTVTQKFQNPITEFYFDKNLLIDVVRLNMPVDKSLNEIITSSAEKNLTTDGITYLEMHGRVLFVNFKTGRNKAQYINCNFYGAGNDNSQIRNDSIVYFHSNFKLFSINYNHSDTAAIWASTDGRPPKIPAFALPIDILFIKRHGAVYLLIMSVNDSKANLPVNTLYNLVCGSNMQGYAAK